MEGASLDFVTDKKDHGTQPMCLTLAAEGEHQYLPHTWAAWGCVYVIWW